MASAANNKSNSVVILSNVSLLRKLFYSVAIALFSVAIALAGVFFDSPVLVNIGFLMVAITIIAFAVFLYLLSKGLILKSEVSLLASKLTSGDINAIATYIPLLQNLALKEGVQLAQLIDNLIKEHAATVNSTVANTAVK